MKHIEDPNTKIILRYKQDLIIKDDLLYQKVQLKKKDSITFQFIVPCDYRKQALIAVHNEFGYLGIDISTILLQERFFWPRMNDDICSHIRECECCIAYKQPPEQEELQPILTSYPLEMIHMDFLSIGQAVQNKSLNMLVITDHFTKYAQAVVMPKQTVPIVAKALWQNWLIHYGWHAKILTDRGKSFENKLIHELCKIKEIQKLRTMPYRPQTNGSCERFNSTLLNMIGTLPQIAKKNWPEWVGTLTQAYNCTMSQVTGCSPYYLIYGRTPKLPIDIEFRVTFLEISESSHQNYADKLNARLKWAYKVACETNEKELSRHKRYYDKKYRCMKILPGDLVLVRIKAFNADHKIADHWEQVPYEVVDQIDKGPVYRV